MTLRYEMTYIPERLPCIHYKVVGMKPDGTMYSLFSPQQTYEVGMVYHEDVARNWRSTGGFFSFVNLSSLMEAVSIANHVPRNAVDNWETSGDNLAIIEVLAYGNMITRRYSIVDILNEDKAKHEYLKVVRIMKIGKPTGHKNFRPNGLSFDEIKWSGYHE